MERDYVYEDLIDEDSETVPYRDYQRLEMKLDKAQELLTDIEELIGENEELQKKMEELEDVIRY